MPTWFERVRSLLGALAPKIKNVSLHLPHFGDRRQYHVTVNVNQQPALSVTDSNIVQLNLAGLPDELKRQCLEAIKDGVVDEGALLIDASSATTIQEVQQREASGELQELLSILRPILPQEDFLALRAALHVREAYKAGNRAAVWKLKGEIIQRFGRRGANIANLCTAGYFDEQIIPLLKQTKPPGSHSAAFLDLYNLLINESAFALFVPNGASEDRIKDLIRQRIKVNLQYGLRYVPVHGIGGANVDRIHKCINGLLEQLVGLKLTDWKIVNGTVVYARLEFEKAIVDVL